MVWTKMAGPTALPADRVIRNLKARISTNARDAEAYYLLGRAYYTLFCGRNPDKIQLYGTAENPRFPRSHPSQNEFQETSPRTDRQSIENIRLAIRNITQATILNTRDPGLYQLTLACALEAGAGVAKQIEKGATPKSYAARALKAYERSYLASKGVDRNQQYQQVPLTYENWISVEAAESILRLDPRHRLKADIQKHTAFMRALPPGPITPLIFSLTSKKSLRDLLDPSKSVAFDLDGTGVRQRYLWVQSDTAFLVWQPDAAVPITSGRQLFGSATWWLMTKNAYSAMSLLDDNFDGWLSGLELAGLAIWRDRNQNGIAEPAEVVPIQKSSILAISTVATGKIGRSPTNPNGLKLRDGRTLPTYDWVTQVVR